MIAKRLLEFCRVAVMLGLAVAGASVPRAQDRLKPEQIFEHPGLDVDLPDFPARGLILDVGGGGEGVIGQLKGQQVVAIDLSRRELEEAPGGPLLKIIMDARDLKFLDATFPTATVFFTFMYIDPADHGKVFREIHRVLAPGGRMLIWDASFPRRSDPRQTAVNFPLHIRLPKNEINTGYGVRMVEEQGIAHFVELARTAGFEIVARRSEKGWFHLELKKGT